MSKEKEEKKRKYNTYRYLKGKNRDKIYTGSKYIELLKEQGIVNENFLTIARNLSIEDLIVIKLELTNELFSGKFFSLPLLRTFREVTEEIILRYANSFSVRTIEAHTLLGLQRDRFYYYMKKHGLYREDDEIKKGGTENVLSEKKENNQDVQDN